MWRTCNPLAPIRTAVQVIQKPDADRPSFIAGRHIGDRQTLLDVVAGLEGEKAEAELNREDGLAAIRAEEDDAGLLRVEGVPFFVVNGDLTLSGAQPPDAFLAAFDRASARPATASGGVCPTTSGSGPPC